MPDKPYQHQRMGLPRPSLRLLKSVYLLALIGLIHALLGIWQHSTVVDLVRPLLLVLWGLCGIGLIVLVVWDLLWIRVWRVRLKVIRQLPSRFAVGAWNQVVLQIEHDSKRAIEIFLTDFVPASVDFKSLPISVELIPNQNSEAAYSIRPTERGELILSRIQLVYYSRLYFWVDTLWIEECSKVKVYPNFQPLYHYQIVIAEQSLRQGGERKVRVRGQGLEFHQLRQYQFGDSLKQVDWKATSRLRRLISKDYQAEKDQSILFLLDCGRRMRIQDGELSHFEYSMNALLLLSYIALQQGDSVGLLTFGSGERWLPPGKTSSQVNRILNTLYDQQTSTVASDYLLMAHSVLAKLKRRSLVILLTNVRDENLDELLPAVKHLQQRHILLLVNLREASLDAVLKQPITDFSSAMRYASTVYYLQQCQAVHDRLIDSNVIAVETTPQQLPSRLIAHYQTIKQRSQL